MVECTNKKKCGDGEKCFQVQVNEKVKQDLEILFKDFCKLGAIIKLSQNFVGMFFSESQKNELDLVNLLIDFAESFLESNVVNNIGDNDCETKTGNLEFSSLADVLCSLLNKDLQSENCVNIPTKPILNYVKKNKKEILKFDKDNEFIIKNTLSSLSENDTSSSIFKFTSDLNNVLYPTPPLKKCYQQ